MNFSGGAVDLRDEAAGWYGTRKFVYVEIEVFPTFGGTSCLQNLT